MSEPESELESSQDPEDEGPAPTPFDHPLFLPILMLGLMVWFGYDGWINMDPEMLEHRTFNRGGFGLLLIGVLYFGSRGLKEWKQDRDKDAQP